MPSFPETHEQGFLAVENPEVIESFDLSDCDFGIQVGNDGRVWVCVNGVAWLRFRPHRKEKEVTT